LTTLACTLLKSPAHLLLLPLPLFSSHELKDLQPSAWHQQIKVAHHLLGRQIQLRQVQLSKVRLCV
jgi:hypothetical protein